MNGFCRRCGYEWLLRTKVPKQCPRCKNIEWNVKRKTGINCEQFKQPEITDFIE